jgi:cephalosporin-C deacetylase-like acetyl esterase
VFKPFDARQAEYGVHAYRVTYGTVDVYGKVTTASGLVALPDCGRTELRAVSYQHGTRAARREVASVEEGTSDRAAVLLIASAGYAAVGPDYLGLGLGPGNHPYMDAASETTASIDLLRAARTVASQQHRRLDPRILVTGFSQGGQAAMALGRALQGGADPYLRLGALARLAALTTSSTRNCPGCWSTATFQPSPAHSISPTGSSR